MVIYLNTPACSVCKVPHVHACPVAMGPLAVRLLILGKLHSQHSRVWYPLIYRCRACVQHRSGICVVMRYLSRRTGIPGAGGHRWGATPFGQIGSAHVANSWKHPCVGYPRLGRSTNAQPRGLAAGLIGFVSHITSTGATGPKALKGDLAENLPHCVLNIVII